MTAKLCFAVIQLSFFANFAPLRFYFYGFGWLSITAIDLASTSSGSG
jgi:hypothetical protein